MKYNTNDYVVVNGKRYYAMGGDTKITENIEVEPSDGDYYGTGYTSISEGSKNAPERNRSVGAGHVFYERLGRTKDKEGNWVDGKQSAAMRKAFTDGRVEIGKLLSNVPQRILDKYGIDVAKWNEDTETYKNDFNSNQLNYGYNNDNSQRVHYFLSQLKDDPHFNATDNDIKNGKIPLGSNVTYGIATFKYKPNMLISRSKEMTAIRNLLGEENYDMFYELKDKEGKGTGKYNVKDKDFSRYVDPDTGYKYITVGRHEPSKKYNGKYITTGSKTIVLDENDNVVPIVPIYNDKGRIINFRVANPDDTNAVNYIDTVKYGKTAEGDQRYRYYKANTDSYIHNNNLDLFADYNTAENPIDYPKHYSHALGGRTSRLYAVGGLTGEQIPIGEQPEDYNMVGAGGSHEQNPMGGVPYGVNQDGSQNMVEEGEVSVGNNVFSDRTAISPELCQQLGLPEGTSPAQARTRTNRRRRISRSSRNYFRGPGNAKTR